MGIKHLGLIFGVVHSVYRKVINRMLRWVVKKPKNHPLAKVRFPAADKMALFTQLIQAHDPLLDYILGFLNGFSLASECSSEVIEQNTMYNG
jgi:hypothetical protein